MYFIHQNSVLVRFSSVFLDLLRPWADDVQWKRIVAMWMYSCRCCDDFRKSRWKAAVLRPEKMWVQRDTFLYTSWLVALCSSGLRITIINKGSDILPALYWQVLDLFPFLQNNIWSWRMPWLLITRIKNALDATSGSEKRYWSCHASLQTYMILFCFILFFSYFSQNQSVDCNLEGRAHYLVGIFLDKPEWGDRAAESRDLWRILCMGVWALLEINFQFSTKLKISYIPSSPACRNSLKTYQKKISSPELVKKNLKEKWKDIYLCDGLNWATVSEVIMVCLNLNDEGMFFLCVFNEVSVFLTRLLICLLSLMWHVFSPVLLCWVALSPRWVSFSVPLWDAFDFMTCGETFHLLIFPGVWGCNRLCKHKLIHHQLHNRLQSFLIPLKSLWTTMKMNFLPATIHGLLKKK